MLGDWEPISKKSRAGGQGTVVKVRHRVTGQVGGLKRIHPAQASIKERRYRFLREVGALQALEGAGAPRVIDSNEAEWLDPGAELFLVMEWIDGPTLTEAVNRRRPSLENAISATTRICEVLDRCHALGVHHRDLKPDNVILRDSEWSQPVLVDFGISWAKPPEDAENVFETPDGVELGNRFLRLPEFAPGGDHYESRSDVSMAVGLLFFMLAGTSPRVLQDARGRFPHEAAGAALSSEAKLSPHWPKVRRIFTIGFQPRLEARFQTAKALGDFLQQEPQLPTDDVNEELAREAQHLKDLYQSETFRQVEEAKPAMMAAQDAVWEPFRAILGEHELMAGGQGPTFREGGRVNAFRLLVSRAGLPDPHVEVGHSVQLINGQLVALTELDGRAPIPYFFGSPVDVEGIEAAATAQVKRMVVEVMRRLREKLDTPSLPI